MFEPWVGPAYGEAGNALGGHRVMVLGESHHNSDVEPGTCIPGFTKDVVRTCVFEGEERRAFFSKISGLVTGKAKWELGEEGHHAAWNALLFYNYVPVIAAEGARLAPTDEMFKAGASLLPQVIAEHKPQVILVCGGRLWWWVLNGIGHPGRPDKIERIDLHGVPAARIGHPSSSGFSYDRWRPVYRELLTRIHP